MAFTDEYLFIQFDLFTLQNQPQIRTQLLKFYCDMWRYDPNFGEYKRCPVCKKFYNYDQVEKEKIVICSGSTDKPHQTVDLIEAWTEEGVWNDLLPLLNKGDDFFGAVAVVPQSGRIIGFVWGYACDFASLTQKWDPELVSDLYFENPSETVTYFQEIAVDRSFRKIGVGAVLARMLVKWMKQNYPDCPSYLHTHIKSSAFGLFQKAGYQLHSYLPGPNQGRILMTAYRSGYMTPENLKNY